MKVTMTACALTAVLLIGTSCFERVVYVREPPPPPAGESPAVVEVVPAAPGPDYVWVAGTWEWQDHWVWFPGRYIVRPHPRAVWIGGAWVRHGRGYAWVHGHWH